MRASHKVWMRLLSRAARCAATVAVAAAWGCATANKDAPPTLGQMSSSLEAKQYEQVVAASNQFMAATPEDAGAPGALYLRGRAYEDQPNQTAAQATANLQNARTAYIAALDHNPPPLLESYIRASLANVAYFQDDYATAAQQWLAACDHLDSADLKSWSLYRAGVSRQRLGEFAKADPLFRQVMQEYPNTVPAQRSREHLSARSFYVQLAAYSTLQRAQTAVADARRQGVNTQIAADGQGHFILRTTALPTYAAARAAQSRLSGTYPGAFVFP